MPTQQLKQFITALATFDFAASQDRAISANTDALVQLQKKQLLEGKDSNGNYIEPFYSQDSFFKSAVTAARYAEYKKRIEPKMNYTFNTQLAIQNSERPLDVPNLFITGKYHKSLFLTITSNSFFFSSNDDNAKKIQLHFPNALGLNEKSELFFAKAFVLPAVSKELREKTGLSINVWERALA